AVVDELYLDGGTGDDRIIGSDLADLSDVIIGGKGSDRVTGGAGEDQFFEVTDIGDANEDVLIDKDTLIESRDANFWLSDRSLRIDDSIIHNQFGDERESFDKIFEGVELYGFNSANRFVIAGWSESGILDGDKGGDTYELELSSGVSGQQYFDIRDTGASGIDQLIFKGSAANDTIQLDTVYVPNQDEDREFKESRWQGFGSHGDGLIIGHFNAESSDFAKQDVNDEESLMRVEEAKLQRGDNFQVVNYATVEQISVFGGAGADKIISDDTSTKIDIFGNEGNDEFYIGSVLETEQVLVEGQIITIVKQITNGARFNGTTYYGGDDDDYFEVNHNIADINLYGDNGDDTFLVKALLTVDEDEELVDLESKTAKVSGTFGEDSGMGADTSLDTREIDSDTLVYVANANVAIDGGAGFDSVSLVGTVLADTFYVYTEVATVSLSPPVPVGGGVVSTMTVDGAAGTSYILSDGVTNVTLSSEADADDIQSVLERFTTIGLNHASVTENAGVFTITITNPIGVPVLSAAAGKPIQRLYGAGVKLQKLLNIERLQLLAGGGDDTIYLYGVDMGVIGDMVIKAGSGSDTIIVGGSPQQIKQSFPKNSDLFFSTVEGFEVNTDALGKYVRAGSIDGLPFYEVRSVGRVTPFVVENPAYTTSITMPASYDLAAFKSPVLIEGGGGLNDRIEFNLTEGNDQLTLGDNDLFKKKVDWDFSKLSLESQADDFTKALLLAGGTEGTEARDLLNGAVTDYLRFIDRYYRPNLLDSLLALSGSDSTEEIVPAGLAYYNLQSRIEGDLTAAEQLIKLGQPDQLDLTLNLVVVDNLDPNGQDYQQLLGINKSGADIDFVAQHADILDENGIVIANDLVAVTFEVAGEEYRIQTRSKVVSAREQLLDFANDFGLDLQWLQVEEGGVLVDGVPHPDRTRANLGERLYELTGISKDNVSLEIETQHTETIVFDGNDKIVVKDLTGLSFKTTAALKVTVSADAIVPSIGIDSLVLSYAANDFIATLFAAGGDDGDRVRRILGSTASDYIYSLDATAQPGLLRTLVELSGSDTQDVVVPSGTPFFETQQSLSANPLSAGEQLEQFADEFGLTLVWNAPAFPDELVSISKNSVPVLFESVHSGHVLASLSLKTAGALTATVGAGTVGIQSDPAVAMSTLAETGDLPELYFFEMKNVSLSLSNKSTITETTLHVDNEEFVGRLNVVGGDNVDRIYIESVKAETVVHAGGGDDVITVGSGLLDKIGQSLYLFGDAGNNDEIIINNATDPTGRVVDIDKMVLEHSTDFEKLSRITNALGLQGITANENAVLESQLKEAAVPYGEQAMNVDEQDLINYRDFAAAGLLGNIEEATTDLQQAFDDAVQDAVDLLKERDQELLENHIKLYVRARYYEQGPASSSAGSFETRSYLTDEILRRLNTDFGVNTRLEYRDYDSYWSPFSTKTYIDWGDSNAVTRDWNILGGLKEIREFFEDPDGKFDDYGLGGVSDDGRAGRYLDSIRNLLTGRSLHSLLSEAFNSPAGVRLGGGQLDGDEHMWILLKANGVASSNKANVLALAKIYDEVVKDYIGSSSIYRDLLLQRGLTTTQLNTLFEAFKPHDRDPNNPVAVPDDPGKNVTRGFDWDVTQISQPMITKIEDTLPIEVAESYRKLTPGVKTKVDYLESTAAGSFQEFYTDEIVDLKDAVDTAQASHNSTNLNAVITAAESLLSVLNPILGNSVDATVSAEAKFIKSPVYNLFATATGNGSVELLRDVKSLSESTEQAIFTVVANLTTTSTYQLKSLEAKFTELSNQSNTPNYVAIVQAYRDAVELVDNFRIFNARYLGDQPTSTTLDGSILALKRLDRQSNRFAAFDEALGDPDYAASQTVAELKTGDRVRLNIDVNRDGEVYEYIAATRPSVNLTNEIYTVPGGWQKIDFNFDTFRDSFLNTQTAVTGFIDQHPEYTAAIFDESRSGAQEGSLLQDGQDIAQPVAVNRIQHDLFADALTQAKAELKTLIPQLIKQYTVTYSFWWFTKTFRLDWTRDARYTQKVKLIKELTAKVSLADSFSDRGEGQQGNLEALQLGYGNERLQAKAKVDADRNTYELLKDKINGQFVVLKELSKFAIDVLSNSPDRVGQSAASFVDTGSLISELINYSEEYSILEAMPANANPSPIRDFTDISSASVAGSVGTNDDGTKTIHLFAGAGNIQEGAIWQILDDSNVELAKYTVVNASRENLTTIAHELAKELNLQDPQYAASSDVKQLSFDVTFTDQAGMTNERDTITRNDGGSWIGDGFEIGSLFEIRGASQASNNGVYRATAVTEDELTLTSDVTLSNGTSLVTVLLKSSRITLTHAGLVNAWVQKKTSESSIIFAVSEKEHDYVTSITGLNQNSAHGIHVGYSDVENLTLFFGTNVDVVTVHDTHTGTSTLNTGPGNDQIDVQMIHGLTNINSGDDDDTINVGTNTSDLGDDIGSADGITTMLAIDMGGGDIDILNVDDGGDSSANTGELSATGNGGPSDDLELAGLSAGLIKSRGLEKLNVYLGTSNNTFNVASNLTASAVTIFGRDGGGTYTIGSDVIGLANQVGDVTGIRNLVEIRAGSGVKEVQRLTVGAGVTGDITLNIQDPDNPSVTLVTPSIVLTSAAAQNAANIANALNNEAVLGANAVAVTAASGDYLIAFNHLGDFAQIGIDSESLSGGATASTSTTTPGQIDRLNFDNRGGSDGTGTLGEASITGFGMGAPGIAFAGLEDLQIGLSDVPNRLFVLDTHAGYTTVDAGNGSDTFSLRGISGVTRINGGMGDDKFNVNFEADGRTQTSENNIGAELWLHGLEGGDEYLVGLAGEGSARINVLDQSQAADLAVNSLTIYGTVHA
ncbi:MAG: hypothetical protein ACI9HK_002074, partial [Pirellulaceae bacterium]